MDRAYWDLFWTTGMPEAWLMSRDREAAAPPVAKQGGIQETGGPDVLSPLPGGVPGSLKNLY